MTRSSRIDRSRTFSFDLAATLAAACGDSDAAGGGGAAPEGGGGSGEGGVPAAGGQGGVGEGGDGASGGQGGEGGAPPASSCFFLDDAPVGDDCGVFIDGDARAGGDGTKAAPYRTLTEAIAAKPGPYYVCESTILNESVRWARRRCASTAGSTARPAGSGPNPRPIGAPAAMRSLPS